MQTFIFRTDTFEIRKEEIDASIVSGLLLFYEMGAKPGVPKAWKQRVKNKMLEMYPTITHEALERVILIGESMSTHLIKERYRGLENTVGVYEALMHRMQQLDEIKNEIHEERKPHE